MERVSDPIDMAAQLEEAERAHAARLRKPETPRTGQCATCGEPLAVARAVVCDLDCQQEYERMLQAARRNGRPL